MLSEVRISDCENELIEAINKVQEFGFRFVLGSADFLVHIEDPHERLMMAIIYQAFADLASLDPAIVNDALRFILAGQDLQIDTRATFLRLYRERFNNGKK